MNYDCFHDGCHHHGCHHLSYSNVKLRKIGGDCLVDLTLSDKIPYQEISLSCEPLPELLNLGLIYNVRES